MAGIPFGNDIKILFKLISLFRLNFLWNFKYRKCSDFNNVFNVNLLLTFILIISNDNFITATSINQTTIIIPVFINNSSSIPEDYQNLPKVGKCCPIGEILERNELGDVKCKSIDQRILFSPYFHDFNRTGVSSFGQQKSTFIAQIGDPCHSKRYILQPEQSIYDQFYLLANGSIFTPSSDPQMLSPLTDYCMEFYPNDGILRVFVCFKEEDENAGTNDMRLKLYASGLLISVPFLILTIIAYCITPKIMDVYGKALCHYCGCLAVAFTNLAITQLANTQLSNQACVSIAFIIQFSFVACFFWLNVMCIETYLQVKRYMTDLQGTVTQNKLFFYYSLWAWIPSGSLIIVSMIMDLNPTVPSSYVKPRFGAESCWFESDREAMPYFYVPIGMLIVFNIILFSLTAIEITRHQRVIDLQRLREDRASSRNERRMLRRLRRSFIICLGLFFLMGMNWTMEVISWWADGDPLAWSAFDLVNALQGIIVFSIFVLKKPVRQLVWRQIQVKLGVIRSDQMTDENTPERTLLTVLNIDTLSVQRISN